MMTHLKIYMIIQLIQRLKITLTTFHDTSTQLHETTGPVLLTVFWFYLETSIQSYMRVVPFLNRKHYQHVTQIQRSYNIQDILLLYDSI